MAAAMRVMELHAPMQTVKRSEGGTATAKAAYRAAERVECERTGQVHDYSRKRGIRIFRGDVMYDNQPMLTLLKGFGFSFGRSEEAGIVRCTLDLQAAPPLAEPEVRASKREI